MSVPEPQMSRKASKKLGKIGKRRKSPFATRKFSLCARFEIDPEEAVDQISEMSAFWSFWVEAEAHSRRARQRELAAKERELSKRKRQLAKLVRLTPKVSQIIEQCFSDVLSIEEAATQIKRLLPEPDLARTLFNGYTRASKMTPEQTATESDHLARRESDLARSDADLARREGLEDARLNVSKALASLAEAAFGGDMEAIQFLVDAATHASLLVASIEKKQPLMVRKLAGQKTFWPLLANDESDWQTGAVARMSALGLGSELGRFMTRFRTVRGCDDNWPARRWAKRAVRTLEESRVRLLLFGQIIRGFESSGAFADWCMQMGWDMTGCEKWSRNIENLPPLTKQTLRPWKIAVRDLIREQIPAFHTHSDWNNQRNTAKASGRGSKGVVQNRILEDICDALEGLAPRS